MLGYANHLVASISHLLHQLLRNKATIPQNHSIKAFLHPFSISSGSFRQHSTYQKVFVNIPAFFYWLTSGRRRSEEQVMSYDYNSGMRRSVNSCWCSEFSLCFYFKISVYVDLVHASNLKLKQGLACTKAASCQKSNFMKALITRKCAVKDFFSWNVLIFLCSPR